MKKFISLIIVISISMPLTEAILSPEQHFSKWEYIDALLLNRYSEDVYWRDHA